MSEMNKVLFSTTSFDTIDNGPALFANLLYDNTIKSDKYDVRIITEDLHITTQEREKLYRLNLQQNTFNRFFYQFFRIVQYHNKAVKIKKVFNYDVLVYNNAFTGLISVKILNKPVVVMINDYNRRELIERGLGFNKNYFKNLLLFNFEKVAAKNADFVIVNSKFLKDTVHNMYGVSKPKIKVLYKGIDLKKYNFRLREKYGKAIGILFVKGDFENGGFYELVDAITLLREYKIKLTIVGPRLIDLDKIEKYLIEKGLTNYEINGPMRPEKVKTYLDKADIFCVPSHKEALGVANMEALASGLPVISTNVGGIPEVLDQGKCGWLVEPGNAKQLAGAIKDCIENPKKRIEKSKYGHEFVQRFNADNLISNFLKIVDEVVE